MYYLSSLGVSVFVFILFCSTTRAWKMRNVFVVLVSLCIGLVSGFIVPPSTTKPASQTNNNIENNRKSEKLLATSTPKYAELPKNRNDIDEKDLYEHATEKQNNQSERAFIFINQKYKKPVRNRMFKVTVPDISASALTLDTVPLMVTSVPRHLCTPSEAAKSNSYFQGYDFPQDRQIQAEIASYNAPPNILRCNFKEKVKNTQEIEMLNKMQAAVKSVQTAHREDERREYFELLKPPILRSHSRGHSKTNMGSVPENDLTLLAKSPNKDTFLNNYSLKSRYLSNANLAEQRPMDMRKKYGFYRPYIHHPVFRNKELLGGVEEPNFEGNFANEDDTRRIFDSNQEEDKLLDKYLKDTLEEQALSNDKANGNKIDCSYRDCILQTSKQYMNNGRLLKPECKCGRRLNLKKNDSFVARDRSLREEGKRNDTVPKSTELNYYEEMLTDDSNNNKLLDDDVIRPPNKLNKTSLH